MIRSHDATERNAGVRALLDISGASIRTASEKRDTEARRLAHRVFRDAVVANGGIRPLVRALRAIFASPYETECGAHCVLDRQTGDLVLGPHPATCPRVPRCVIC